MIDFHCDNCEFLQDKSNDNIIDGYCKKYNQSLTFYDWFEKCDKCLIETLQSENAALRERLGKSVELPFGDRVWFITEDEEGAESYIISKPTDLLTVDELYEIGKKYFTTREAAEKRLAELNGGKQ